MAQFIRGRSQREPTIYIFAVARGTFDGLSESRDARVAFLPGGDEGHDDAVRCAGSGGPSSTITVLDGHEAMVVPIGL